MKKSLPYLLIALLFFCACANNNERKLITVTGKYMLSIQGSDRKLLYTQTLILLRNVDSVGYNKEYVLAFNGSYHLTKLSEDRNIATAKNINELQQYEVPKLQSVEDFIDHPRESPSMKAQ